MCGTLIGLAVSILAPASPASAGPVRLPERTRVRVRLIQTLDSRSHMKKGVEIRFEVAEDVLGPRGEVLISRGAPAAGTILRCSRRGFFGNPGKLDFSIDETQAVDGTRVELRGTEDHHGRNNKAAAISTGVLLFVPALFIKGRDVKIEKGREFAAFVDQDVMVAPRGASGPTFAPPPAPAQRAHNLCTLHLKNGDTITGVVEGLRNGVYTVATPNGTLRIAQASVSTISQKGWRS